MPAPPYFIHVDGQTAEIVGQGAGVTWSQVSSLLRQATGADQLVRTVAACKASAAGRVGFRRGAGQVTKRRGSGDGGVSVRDEGVGYVTKAWDT